MAPPYAPVPGVLKRRRPAGETPFAIVARVLEGRGLEIHMGSSDETAPSRPPVSAIITTFNEERNIAACIESLLWCDEIVLVDSHSIDRTAEIVRSYVKVRFLERDYFGSASQKNWAIDQTAHEWILIFDADEVCPVALRREIERELAAPRAESYVIRRRAYFMDRMIRFSGWRNDSVVRLFRRGAARYPNKRVHADMVTRGTPAVLRTPMQHFMIDDFGEYVRRVVTYGIWGAAQEWRRGRSTSALEVAFRPAWRFFRMYVVQLGVLDGAAGLVFCLLQAFASYTKWSTLWAWRRNARRGRQPHLPPFDEDDTTWQEGRDTGTNAG
ncbi:MAG: glycosyltransferase family 2 protein [Acidobacteriota bacterium]